MMYLRLDDDPDWLIQNNQLPPQTLLQKETRRRLWYLISCADRGLAYGTLTTPYTIRDHRHLYEESAVELPLCEDIWLAIDAETGELSEPMEQPESLDVLQASVPLACSQYFELNDFRSGWPGNMDFLVSGC